jgi:hypothetical protein
VEPPTALLDAGAPGLDGGVTVISEESTGPYDVVVLGSASAADVSTWLRDHGYVVPDRAVPLLQAYEGTSRIFVALRLAARADVSDLRPIVLRMPTEAMALPIRLTAIASVPGLFRPRYRNDSFVLYEFLDTSGAPTRAPR